MKKYIIVPYMSGGFIAEYKRALRPEDFEKLFGKNVVYEENVIYINNIVATTSNLRVNIDGIFYVRNTPEDMKKYTFEAESDDEAKLRFELFMMEEGGKL